MTDQQQQEREAFEAWYRANWSDRFGTAICDASWAIWRAAWQARASLAVQPAVVPAGGVPLLVGVDRAEGVDTTVTAYKCQGCGCINVVSESVVPARPVGDTELAALLKLAESEAAVYEREGINGAANLIRDLIAALRAATAAGEAVHDAVPLLTAELAQDVLNVCSWSGACDTRHGYVEGLKAIASGQAVVVTAPPEQGWRPIESAPSGLVLTANFLGDKLYWVQAAHRGKGALAGCFYTPTGTSVGPTHWMPLPALSAEQGWREDALRLDFMERTKAHVTRSGSMKYGTGWYVYVPGQAPNDYAHETLRGALDAAMKSPQGDPDDFNDTDKNEGLPPWA